MLWLRKDEPIFVTSYIRYSSVMQSNTIIDTSHDYKLLCMVVMLGRQLKFKTTSAIPFSRDGLDDN